MSKRFSILTILMLGLLAFSCTGKTTTQSNADHPTKPLTPLGEMTTATGLDSGELVWEFQPGMVMYGEKDFQGCEVCADYLIATFIPNTPADCECWTGYVTFQEHEGYIFKAPFQNVANHVRQAGTGVLCSGSKIVLCFERLPGVEQCKNEPYNFTVLFTNSRATNIKTLNYCESAEGLVCIDVGRYERGEDGSCHLNLNEDTGRTPCNVDRVQRCS